MERKQIATKDVKYLLLAQWPAKLCILLPVVLSGLSTGNMARSIVTGVLLWCLVIGVVQRWIRPGEDVLRVLEGRAGRTTAVIFGAASFWYFLMHTAVFARLWAELLRTYLTPAVPAPVLCVIPLAVGLVCLRRGPAFCARVCKYAGIPVLVLAAAPACFAGNEILIGAWASAAAGEQISPDGFLRSAWEVFLCIGGMFLPLLSEQCFAEAYEKGGVGKRREASKDGETVRDRDSRRETDCRWSIRRTGCVCAAAAGAYCILSDCFLTLQERGADDFPAVEAMRVWRPSGFNVGRAEHLLALLLLAGLTMTVAGGLWCVGKSFACLYAAGVRFYHGFVSGRLWKRLPDIYGKNAGEQEFYGAEFAGELSDLPVLRKAKYYGIRMTEKLTGFPYAERIRCYSEKITDHLTAERIWRWIVLLTAYMLAIGFSGAFAAITFYRAYNIQILSPVMLVFYLAVRGKARP